MRAKIPQLQDALQSRFAIDHHRIMAAQLLAHIDTLDAALASLSERIEFVLAPHAQITSCSPPSPASTRKQRRSLTAECGLDMSVFPTVGHFASWAGLPRAPRTSRPRTVGTDPSRAGLADLAAHRIRPGSRAHQRHVPRRALRRAPRAPQGTKSGRRDPPRPCSSRTSRSSATTSLIETSDPTGRASATPSSTAPDASSSSSKRSATPSPSISSTNQRNKQPDPTCSQAGYCRPTAGTNGRAQTRPSTLGFTGHPLADARADSGRRSTEALDRRRSAKTSPVALDSESTLAGAGSAAVSGQLVAGKNRHGSAAACRRRHNSCRR